MPTIRIMHDDKVITSFVCEWYEYPEYNVAWHEVPVVSDRWEETDARLRVSQGRSKRRGAPPGMLDKQEHAPRYYGIPYLRLAEVDLAKYDGPSQWSWGDGKAMFSMPRDGDKPPGSDAVFRIKYQFPDGGSPIWHRNLAAALDAIVSVAAEDWSDGVTLRQLRRVVEQVARHDSR